MRKLIIALIASVCATAAFAVCTGQVVVQPDGNTTICQVCCYPGGSCSTVCQ
jgi:hypothetical protein